MLPAPAWKKKCRGRHFFVSLRHLFRWKEPENFCVRKECVTISILVGFVLHCDGLRWAAYYFFSMVFSTSYCYPPTSTALLFLLKWTEGILRTTDRPDKRRWIEWVLLHLKEFRRFSRHTIGSAMIRWSPCQWPLWRWQVVERATSHRNPGHRKTVLPSGGLSLPLFPSATSFSQILILLVIFWSKVNTITFCFFTNSLADCCNPFFFFFFSFSNPAFSFFLQSVLGIILEKISYYTRKMRLRYGLTTFSCSCFSSNLIASDATWFAWRRSETRGK